VDSQLAAVIVHDIKNALGILENELLVMAENPSRERAFAAHGNCAALRDKLIGFLTLYKSDTQGLAPRIEAVNPEDFLDGLVRQRAPARPELKIVIDKTDMPVIGFFDENLVGLALEAALQNATRFARGTVTLCCRQQEGELVFSVGDDGPGLGAAEAKPSTGLGMALCDAIARAHRKGDRAGRAWLRNGARGGALFSLYLP